MVDVNREMGSRLGYLRERKFGKFHGSKKICAQTLNISNGYWGDIERGRKRIGVDLVQRFATFFDAENEWLLSGKSHNGKFLTEYYLCPLFEKSSWYTKLLFLVELAVYWREKDNNQFYNAAAAALECHKEKALFIESAAIFETDEITDLIDSLLEITPSQESRDELTYYISKIASHLIEVERPEQFVADLPAFSAAIRKQKDTGDEPEGVVNILKSRITKLEQEKVELRETVKKLKKKLKKAKKNKNPIA